MDKNRRDEIVSVLIDFLKNAPDGYNNSSARLMMAAGYNLKDYSGLDLLEIHFALFDAAEKAGLTLDMSSHDDKEEGMPYSLDFVLRKKRV